MHFDWNKIHEIKTGFMQRLKVLRGHFSKLSKSIDKTGGGMGVPLSFPVDTLLTT